MVLSLAVVPVSALDIHEPHPEWCEPRRDMSLWRKAAASGRTGQSMSHSTGC